MANLSQEKRARMLAFLETIRQEHKDDDDVLVAVNEIESELKAKKYGIVWEKHEESVDEQMRNNIPVFTECKEREIVDAPNEKYNFILEGDNLHSLRLLEKTHKEKIDVIYIDPPYNRGDKDNNDFIYDDRRVEKEDSYRHSKWLSFMYERLLIAKQLLSKEGVIFISIDDHEQTPLKMLCDEVFYPKNFVGTFFWKRTSTPPALSHKIRKKLEYVLCYQKNDIAKRTFAQGYVDGGDVPLLNSGNPIGTLTFPAGTVKFGIDDGVYSAKSSYKIELLDDVFVENGINVNSFRASGHFKWGQKNLEEEVNDGTYFLIKSKMFSPRFQKTDKSTKIPSNIIDDEVGVGTNEDANAELESLGLSFDYAKPSSLISYLIKMPFWQEKDITILDFFAGSGTTGHAVLKLNTKDDGHRCFILCTNNENKICEDVTYERIKRVIKGYGNADGIPANVKYFKTDFVSKESSDVENELLKHIVEMVELENGVKIDSQKNLIVLSDEEADELARNWSSYPDVEALYVANKVLFTSEQRAIFGNVNINIIPDYYFKFEMQEVGEIW